MQYDGSTEGTCEYLGYSEAGIIAHDEFWFVACEIMCYALLVNTFLHLFWIYLSFPLTKAVTMAERNITSRVMLAHEMKGAMNEIYGDSESSFATMERDIIEKVGDTTIFYGVKLEWIDRGIYKLGFGLRKQVVPIKKLLTGGLKHRQLKSIQHGKV
jgi:hypothetical protein